MPVSTGTIDCGIVLVDKPAGVTSHDVVFRLRREFSATAGRKVKTGHAGTLDPFATGLLVVLVGRATRLQRYLLHQDKRYLVTARLGWRSDSGDSDGELTETGRVPTDPQIPTGLVTLPVPKLSAIKVDGQRLYAKTRKGEEFEPPVREMTVYRAERMALSQDTAVFEIDCAGGTYVRSLVDTIEDAYCLELRRLRVGELSIEDADETVILDPSIGLTAMPTLELSDRDALTVIAGRKFEAPDLSDGAVALNFGGRLLGVAQATSGVLAPETVLAGSLEKFTSR